MFGFKKNTFNLKKTTKTFQLQIYNLKKNLPKKINTICQNQMVNYYEKKGEDINYTQLIKDVESNIDDPMVKAFIKMELKSKFRKIQ